MCAKTRYECGDAAAVQEAGRSGTRRRKAAASSSVIWTLMVVLGALINVAESGPSYCVKPPGNRPDCPEKVNRFFYQPQTGTCESLVWRDCGEVNPSLFLTWTRCMYVCAGNLTDSSEIDEPEYSDEEDFWTNETTSEPPLPPSSPHLTLDPSLNATTFTFAKPTSYIQIGPDDISRYQIRNRRSISLEFRTRLPHAILAYHGINNRPSDINKYELYVMLDQGQLKVKHLFGDYSTTLVVGKGLNRDRWHQVVVTIDPADRKITVSVDRGQDVTTQIVEGLREHYLYGADNKELETILFIGGLSPLVGLDISYLAKTFTGCVRNVSLETSPLKTGPLKPLEDLTASHYQDVEVGCISKCWEPTVKCSRDSKCINYYSHVECDCFTAKFKGEKCKEPVIPSLTLLGYSYVSFTVFEWMDRVHSDDNRISMQFKTQLDDSILFYASGETPRHNHVAMSIVNGSVYVDVDFGNGDDGLSLTMGRKVTDSVMHQLTILHQGKNVTVQLDGQIERHTLSGPNYHLYINPDVYVGGVGPMLKNKKAVGLRSSNNFVGCLQEVYFNTKAILYELQQNNLQARHHGVTPPVFDQCGDQQTIPITIPFAASGFKVQNPNVEELNLKFAFRTMELYGTLAYSEIRTLKGEGFWELKYGVDTIIFEVQPDKKLANISQAKNLTVRYDKGKDMWRSVHLTYKGGEIKLCTRQGSSCNNEVFLDLFQLSQTITLGTSENKPSSGFKGCLRRIEIGGVLIDSRHIVGSSDQIGDIALDNCQFIDPCHRPDVCEHGGKCQVENEKVSCDCSATGYEGKRCHFARYKRTCEELALLGYTESGVYKIDIDGNGPYPPSNVKCKFEQDNGSGETKTIVEHNLANETDVWSPNDQDKTDFRLELTYREFTSEMLLSLISQSVQCSQHIKYDCYKARLGLFQYTSFRSADPRESKVVSIGDASRGSCPCSIKGECVKGEHCNCDSNADRWLQDEGYFTQPERLGITQMSFAVPKNLPADAASRITLGPLECVEANTQRYVVTFKTFGSYLEAPGWKSGDLAFSFRTTRSSAILLFQPQLHEKHSAFSVYLTNDYELTFQYFLSGASPKNVTVRSEQKLSNGEWQQVWIDYDVHEVRFQINSDNKMINLPDGQQFGPFEGTMYIAGAPETYLEKSEVKEGLIGCFRGLVMNGLVLDLYSYMKFHKADIIKDCSPSCDPNPCQNDAICQENWGSFVCQCSNPWAHSGVLCQQDINVDGLTFLSQSSYIKKQSLDSEPDPIKHILRSNIYLNIRTYDSEALVLYANDNLNNFVQLHVEDDTKVVFTWNEYDTIRRLSLSLKRLNHGIPVQIAVVRNETHTTLHVNEHKKGVPVGVVLLEKYNEKPWKNPELEIFTPPRPFAPISPYSQLLLGGFDNYALKPAGNATYFPGMLGCLNGLQIGGDHILISGMVNQSNEDVLQGCKMVCDQTPCHNGGICLEDFTKRTYTCECTTTTYYGQHCDEEKGATFMGETAMKRRFPNLEEEVQEIEAWFGFSTVEHGNDTLLLLIQIPKQSYSLAWSLSPKGKLVLIESVEREKVGATVYQMFADGKRHSVYFRRTEEETLYIVDQEEIRVSPFSAEFTDWGIGVGQGGQTGPPGGENFGDVFVGGVTEIKNVPKPREYNKYRNYRRFRGCFSNIFVRVNKQEVIRPMDEYMGFVKKPEDTVLDVDKVEGIKLRCEPQTRTFFVEPDRVGEIGNGSSASDWVRMGPRKVSGASGKKEPVKKGGITFDTLALIVAVFFVTLLLFVAVYVYKINKRYRLRKLYEEEEEDFYGTFRGQPAHYYGPNSTELKYMAVAKKYNEGSGVGLLNNQVAAANNHYPHTNGNKPTVKNNLERSPNEEEDDEDDEPKKLLDDEEDEEDETTSDNEEEEKSGGAETSEEDNQAVDDKDEETLPEDDEDSGEVDPDDHVRPPVVNHATHPQFIGTIEEVPEQEDQQPGTAAGGGVVMRRPPPEDSQANDKSSPSSPRPNTTTGAISPVFISENARTFESSPIAIIGGPRYEQMKRWSKDSIISLD